VEKYRAIPEGYMTVGEIAKKMDITVRTLQYYDKEGVLSPSASSEGGRRLYTHKDMVKLHQIQSMKYLGFSLCDIKTRLPSINTNEEVATVLKEQAKALREKIISLTEVLESIEKLNLEVLQMKTVDWEKYADIIHLLQTKNDNYWMIKHFEGEVLEHMHRFNEEEARNLVNSQNEVYRKMHELQKAGIEPESEEAQILAKEFWDIAMEVSGGDMNILAELSNLALSNAGDEWKNQNEFLMKAISAYFTRLGYNPFEGMFEEEKQ